MSPQAHKLFTNALNKKNKLKCKKKKKRLFSLTRKQFIFFPRLCHCSTREIKPNQSEVGRKIPKKSPSIAPYRPTTTSGQQQLSSSTPNSLISNGKRPLDNSGEGVQHHTSQQQNSTNSSHSYNTDHHHHTYQQHNSALNGVVGDGVGQPRLPGQNRVTGQQNHRNPDIIRKPIK